MKSEAPRTHAAWDESDPLKKLSENERREFAAQLEHELNAALKECAITKHQGLLEQQANQRRARRDGPVRLPRRPWVASNQYGMHFILSQDNEILWRADWLPMEILQAMVKAANETQQPNEKLTQDARR